jgi:hypothetical protein
MAHATQPVPDIRLMSPQLPQETQQIIIRALAKTVHDRFPTPTDLANALTFALGYSQGISSQSEAAPAVEVRDALLMTNMLGQVIFLDHTCLQLLKRPQHEARTVIGKSLHEVLGIPAKTAEQLVKDVSKSGRVDITEMELKDTRGGTIPVTCSAVATYDDKRSFVGMDVTLRPVAKKAEGIVIEFPTVSGVDLDSREESYLQTYFSLQMNALRNLLVQLGGKRVGQNLENIVNETAQRNVWPVSMQDGQIHVQLKSSDADIYRALLAKASGYASSVVGERIVNKEMQKVDGQMDSRILEFVQNLHIR